mmetsp:Transcript_17277/g.39486  ORF Transcript_17277/g.39486 Transcript_17277/m.39486 type:complete len:200 (-) Transcript_17277:524-1123(-)
MRRSVTTALHHTSRTSRAITRSPTAMACLPSSIVVPGGGGGTSVELSVGSCSSGAIGAGAAEAEGCPKRSRLLEMAPLSRCFILDKAVDGLEGLDETAPLLEAAAACLAASAAALLDAAAPRATKGSAPSVAGGAARAATGAAAGAGSAGRLLLGREAAVTCDDALWLLYTTDGGGFVSLRTRPESREIHSSHRCFQPS